MGEVAEMILEGLLCEGCAGYTGHEEAPGYPVLCPECEVEAQEQESGDA